jgi:uncharacterized protein
MKEREFQIFVKPVGATCNLRCSYCYYLEKDQLYPENSPLMSDEILEKYIIQHIGATSDDTIMFSWHGGEPTLAGIEFFKKAFKFQKRHLPAGKSLLNGIQTNATLLNDDFCRFMADEGFIAGVSIDGPDEMHGRHRRTASGESSFSKTMRGYELLVKYGITSEILCVVNAHNVNHPLEVYNFFKSLDARFVTFLPLVIRSAELSGTVTADSVPSEAFGYFLMKIFDDWVEKDISKIKVQVFEEVLRSAFNQDHTLCIFKVNCGGVPVLEQNGDFYSCDHYVNRDHLLGNIKQKSIAEMLDSLKQIKFGQNKSQTLPAYCIDCEVRGMCNGECPKNRFIKTPDGDPGLNYLCAGYKLFFNHCKPFIDVLRQTWLSRRSASNK